MDTKRIVISVLIAWAASLGALVAQDAPSSVSKKGTTAAPFLSISQGARAAAMGSAFVAVADDPTALYWNPGGLTRLSGVGLSFEHTEWLADTKYNFAGVTYSLGDYGALGVSLTLSDIGDMKVTTIEEPNGTGETFKATDIAVSVAYAIRLMNTFSIGFNPKFIHQSIWKTDADALAIDVGILYDTPFTGWTLGMSIANFGTKMRLTGSSTLVLYDPDPISTGNNERIPANLETEYWALPLNFRFGLSYTPALSEDHHLVLAIDASHPSDDYESVNIGGEYVFNDLVALRAGYKGLGLSDGEESFTLGLGLRQRLLGNLRIRIDYAYVDFGRLKNIQKFSLGFDF